jgi:DNA-directed RNA polymerase specialized sigma24 family protein
MSMDHNIVTELLKNYRSYRYAVNNCGQGDESYKLPKVYSERRVNWNLWDATRYNRIVNMIEGAVNEVLSDDERTVIMRKYLERNTMTLNEIADYLHKDRSTISRWHTAAIKRLVIALQPLTADEREITNLDHMFDPNWSYQEPA